MIRISRMALAACLAVSSFRANDAFTVTRQRAPTTATNGIGAARSRSAPALVGGGRRSRPLSLSSSDAEDSASSLKRLPESAVELTLRIPPAATAAAYDKTLADVAKGASIPGFRKGARIPPQVIENAWAKQGGKKALKSMAINELCGELIGKALKDEHDLEPVGQPALVTPAEELAAGFTPGEGFLEVVVRCDVWPDIRWKEVPGRDKPYEGLGGTYKRKPFNQERFDAAIRDLTERYARLEPYDDESQVLTTGDACKVNMVGYMAAADGGKGEPLPDAASGDDVEIILGAGRYMEGLVEGLEGGTVGETKTVSVRFPDALKNKDLAGKDAVFDVTILSASKRILPEVDDEFAAMVRPGLTAEGLRDELRTAVDSQDEQEYAGARNEALARALSAIVDVDVPDTLVTNQCREKYAMMMTEMRDSGMADEEVKKLISPENFVKYKEIEKPDVVRDFRTSMAVDEIARLEGIEVPAYQVEEQMQSLKDQAVKEGQSNEEMDDDQTRRRVESTLERRMVYDLLATTAELDVEYIGMEEEFDEGMMDKLMAESLAREEEAAAKEAGKEEDVAVVAEAALTAVEEEAEEAESPTSVEEEAEEVETEAEPVEEVSSAAPVTSKEEDLERTRQVIMDYIDSQADDDGVVDDDDE